MFDTGVFHAQNPWLQESFGRAEGEGMKLLSAQWQTLNQLMSSSSKTPPNPQKPGWLLGSFLLIKTNFIKLIAYKLGLTYRFLPEFIRPYLSMSKAFWLKK